MPIAFDLEFYRNKYNCVNYFETGLWDPRTEVSSKMALRSNFKKVYCVELREDWIELGKEVFKQEIATGRYTLIHGDSTNMAQYLNDTDFADRTMFFLDAHIMTGNTNNYKVKCPLFDEIAAIGSLSRKDNIIMIDDLRIIREAHPWGETSYGNINFLDRIKQLILQINPAYQFATLDGHVKDDVLLCY